MPSVRASISRRRSCFFAAVVAVEDNCQLIRTIDSSRGSATLLFPECTSKCLDPTVPTLKALFEAVSIFCETFDSLLDSIENSRVITCSFRISKFSMQGVKLREMLTCPLGSQDNLTMPPGRARELEVDRILFKCRFAAVKVSNPSLAIRSSSVPKSEDL